MNNNLFTLARVNFKKYSHFRRFADEILLHFLRNVGILIIHLQTNQNSYFQSNIIIDIHCSNDEDNAKADQMIIIITTTTTTILRCSMVRMIMSSIIIFLRILIIIQHTYLFIFL